MQVLPRHPSSLESFWVRDSVDVFDPPKRESSAPSGPSFQPLLVLVAGLAALWWMMRASSGRAMLGTTSGFSPWTPLP